MITDPLVSSPVIMPPVIFTSILNNADLLNIGQIIDMPQAVDLSNNTVFTYPQVSTAELINEHSMVNASMFNESVCNIEDQVSNLNT